MQIMVRVDRPFLAHIDSEAIKVALKTTLTRFERSVEMSVIITDNKTVQQFNHQFRGVDAPTDVLSFINDPDPDFPAGDDETAAGYLGDVVIAYPIAKQQAKRSGHNPMEEVVLLAVHGTLHLLGFDHDTPARKKEMWATQQQIMEMLKLGHVQPTEGKE